MDPIMRGFLYFCVFFIVICLTIAGINFLQLQHILNRKSAREKRREARAKDYNERMQYKDDNAKDISSDAGMLYLEQENKFEKSSISNHAEKRNDSLAEAQEMFNLGQQYYEGGGSVERQDKSNRII